MIKGGKGISWRDTNTWLNFILQLNSTSKNLNSIRWEYGDLLAIQDIKRHKPFRNFLVFLMYFLSPCLLVYRNLGLQILSPHLHRLQMRPRPRLLHLHNITKLQKIIAIPRIHKWFIDLCKSWSAASPWWRTNIELTIKDSNPFL